MRNTRATIREARELMERDPVMRMAMYREVLLALFQCDDQLVKHLLRDLINYGVGFEDLSTKINIPSKSIHRMLSPRGNPTSRHLFTILRALRVHEGFSLEINLTQNRHEKTALFRAGSMPNES